MRATYLPGSFSLALARAGRGVVDEPSLIDGDVPTDMTGGGLFDLLRHRARSEGRVGLAATLCGRHVSDSNG